MSASSPLPEDVRRDLERMAGPLAERMLPPKVTQSATTRNVVAAVNSDGTLDIAMGGAVMQRVPATTACAPIPSSGRAAPRAHSARRAPVTPPIPPPPLPQRHRAPRRALAPSSRKAPPLCAR